MALSVGLEMISVCVSSENAQPHTRLNCSLSFVIGTLWKAGSHKSFLHCCIKIRQIITLKFRPRRTMK